MQTHKVMITNWIAANGEGLRHITGGTQVREHIPEQDTIGDTRRDGVQFWGIGIKYGDQFWGINLVDQL